MNSENTKNFKGFDKPSSPTSQGELLLPVGDKDMCLAAIHNGADAVYIGVPEFNARGRTKDHSFDELKEMVNLCHLYGVKVHLAFNVLIFQNELEEVEALLKKLLPLGIDAFIVQDIGLVQMIKSMAPWQTVHASTQMTVTSDLAIKLLEDLNIQRFVLGREVSLPEMTKIRKATSTELEVFVHGALCVAYSGQCFTSESIGGRSANRGQCAQSCRLDYEMWVDGKKFASGDQKYFFSPKDLFGAKEIPMLQELGIDSFKVEGRLKGPYYVASVGRAYKNIMQAASRNQLEELNLPLIQSEVARIFSRGFFSGWLHGVNHQQLVDGRFGDNRGEEVGSVVRVVKNTIEIRLQNNFKNSHPLKLGDGLLFVGPGQQEVGGHIYKISKRELSFSEDKIGARIVSINLGHAFAYHKLSPSFKVYINSDAELEDRLKKTWTTREGQKRIPLNIKIKATVGQPIQVEVFCLDQPEEKIGISGDWLLEPATKSPATRDHLQKSFQALSTTAFSLEKLYIEALDLVFIPDQKLKKIKREMVIKLEELRTVRTVSSVKNFNKTFHNLLAPKSSLTQERLSLLLRSRLQVEEFINSMVKQNISSIPQLKRVVLDFEFGQDYQKAMEILRAKGLKVFLATTRILKAGELYNLNNLLRLKPDGLLIRNLGALQFVKDNAPDLPLIGDYSLNVTNALSAEYFLGKGLSEVCLGLDLNQWQVEDIFRAAGGGSFELVAHQYMPEFHMEHCVFAAFLSKGSSFRDCGKPCETHQVKLKDPYGNEHVLAADHECRNTLFRSTPQAIARPLPQWINLGLATIRIEALKESGEEILKKVIAYQKLISGESRSDGVMMLQELALKESFGVEGIFSKIDSYQDRKQSTGHN